MMRFIFSVLLFVMAMPVQAEKTRLKLVGTDYAAQYPAIVAYERYAPQMQYADLQLTLLSRPELVRAYFYSEPDADAAMIDAPMALAMFAEQPNFRWIGLLNRDGVAFAVNYHLARLLQLSSNKKGRYPDEKLAELLQHLIAEEEAQVVAIPSHLSTSAVVLYHYFKDYGITLSLRRDGRTHLLLRPLKPSKTLSYVNKQTIESGYAEVVQSLPWSEMVESEGYGRVAWFSKHVMDHPRGHVDSILIARDETLANKQQAMQEVLNFIRLAARDIEAARLTDGRELGEIIQMIHKHLPNHSITGIRETLRSDLNVINFKNLQIDNSAMNSMAAMMRLAHEAGFLAKQIDLSQFANSRTVPRTLISGE